MQEMGYIIVPAIVSVEQIVGVTGLLKPLHFWFTYGAVPFRHPECYQTLMFFDSTNAAGYF